MNTLSAARETKPAKRSSTYKMLDAWRGIAALWVVMTHATVGLMTDTPGLISQPIYRFSTFGRLGVVMFFVISGYCIAAAAANALSKPQPTWSFAVARLRRIYPPYYASTLLMAVITTAAMWMAAHHHGPPVDHLVPVLGQPAKFYLAALTLTQLPLSAKLILEVYWSLCYEVSFYLIIAICLFALGKKSGRASDGVKTQAAVIFMPLNILSVASLIWLIASPATCPFPLNMWYQFGFGVLLYQLVVDPENKVVRALGAAIVALSIAFAVIHQGPHSLGHPSTRIEAVFCTLFAAFLLWAYRHDARLIRVPVIRAAAWVGTFSYSLYLTHTILRPILLHIGHSLHLVGSRYWASFLLQIVVDIAFAYVFFLIFERPLLSSRARTREATIDPDAGGKLHARLAPAADQEASIATPEKQPVT